MSGIAFEDFGRYLLTHKRKLFFFFVESMPSHNCLTDCSQTTQNWLLSTNNYDNIFEENVDIYVSVELK